MGEWKGGSLGLAKVHPVCVSSESSGRVRCQVGCTMDSPMTSSKPCSRAGACLNAVHELKQLEQLRASHKSSSAADHVGTWYSCNQQCQDRRDKHAVH